MKHLKKFEGFNLLGKEISNYQDINSLKDGRSVNIIVKEYNDYYQLINQNDSGSFKIKKYYKSEYSKKDILKIASELTGYVDNKELWNKNNTSEVI